MIMWLHGEFRSRCARWAARGVLAVSALLVKFLQDLRSFGAPTMHFLDEIESRVMRHDGNPLARWCASNVITKEDAHGNARPHKAASIRRIDPIVAAIMARGRAIVQPPNFFKPPSLGVYAF